MYLHNLAQKQFEELMVMPGERAEKRDYKLRHLKIKVSKWHRLESDLYRDKEISHIDAPPPVAFHEIVSILQKIEYWVGEYVACFLFFPKNAVIKRRVLFSLLPTFLLQTSGTGLGFLVDNGFVEAVYKKCNFTVDGYRMLPSIHAHLRSEASGFSLPRGLANMYVGCSHDVEEKFIYHTTQDFEQFNYNYTGRLETVLHLGKWNNSAEQHIEVIELELFFKHMSKHTELRSVSLCGISMIEELPEFITKLKNLRHLDLRACHNLEVIPPSIADLKDSLTYLDISECYFLDHMPKALASLVHLHVLKGFVVGANKDGKSCSLEDLASLRFLEKLNIYTSVKEFPTKSQLTTLHGFQWLLSLTISWGGCSAPNRLCKSSQEDEYERLEDLNARDYVFVSLAKLDLQCVPESVTRCWLKPTIFRNLKKLYIRGGKFFDLGQSSEGSQWNVQTLRLKHLCKLKMDWGELQQVFPKLMCLEKVDCPNLHRFPCNDSVIWMKNQQA